MHSITLVILHGTLNFKRVKLYTITTDEMIDQSDEMIQYLSLLSMAADLICLWRLKLNFNVQYLSVNELT